MDGAAALLDTLVLAGNIGFAVAVVGGRRFNRARYDAGQAAAFRHRLRDDVELGDVVTTTRSAVVRTVQPVRASVWPRETER